MIEFLFDFIVDPRSNHNPLCCPHNAHVSSCLYFSLLILSVQMMLWIILMGGLASHGTADQTWFIKELAKSCHTVGVVGSLELSHFLSEFLWSDFYLSSVFKAFWSAVTLAQTEDFIQVDDDN